MCHIPEPTMQSVTLTDCIADHHGRFPIVKKAGSLAGHDLVQITKMVFAEYGLHKKIISDTGTYITSETFR